MMIDLGSIVRLSQCSLGDQLMSIGQMKRALWYTSYRRTFRTYLALHCHCSMVEGELPDIRCLSQQADAQVVQLYAFCPSRSLLVIADISFRQLWVHGELSKSIVDNAHDSAVPTSDRLCRYVYGHPK